MNVYHSKYLQVIILIICAGLFSNCGGGSSPTAEERVTKLLKSGTWTVSSSTSSILLEGIDVRDDLFSGLTLRFTDTAIQSTGNSPLWPSTETWQFKPGSKAKALIRGDAREITIVEITSSTFKFTMEWDETTYGGRTTSLPGTYEFTLTK